MHTRRVHQQRAGLYRSAVCGHRLLIYPRIVRGVRSQGKGNQR